MNLLINLLETVWNIAYPACQQYAFWIRMYMPTLKSSNVAFKAPTNCSYEYGWNCMTGLIIDDMRHQALGFHITIEL